MTGTATRPEVRTGADEPPAEAGPPDLPTEARRRYALMLGALVAVQLVVGYEWLISGLTKLVRGGFPGGLAENLTDKSGSMYRWYWSFLDWLVIPNARAFGYLIMWGELAIGVALIGAGLAWLLAGERLSERVRVRLLWLSVVAASAGLVLNVALHLARGSAHPWLLGNDPFDEGVDLDLFMVMVQLVLIVASLILLRGLRQAGSVLAPASRRDEPGA